MTCKEDCYHYEACSGFSPSDLQKDVWDYFAKGREDEIPDIEDRCPEFKNKSDLIEVVNCKDCIYHNVPPCPMRLSLNWTNDNDFCSYGKKKEGAEE